MKVRQSFFAIATLSVFAAGAAQAQSYGYTGPGTTRYQGVPMAPAYQPPPPRAVPNPTETWTYRTAEVVTPWVGRVRDCSFGALGGAAFSAARGGNPYLGMATGCAGAVQPTLSPYRPLRVY